MSAVSQVLQLKLHAAMADVPPDVMRDAVEICRRIGADTEIMPGVPSLEVLCAAAAIFSERERHAS